MLSQIKNVLNWTRNKTVWHMYNMYTGEKASNLDYAGIKRAELETNFATDKAQVIAFLVRSQRPM